MPTSFSHRWQDLETRRAAIVARVAAMPPREQQNGTHKRFSPAEVLEHMALSEEYYISLIQGTQPSSLAGKRARGNFVFKIVVKTLAKARQVPTVEEMSPKSKCSVELGKKHWATVRERLKPLLEAAADTRPILKHPMFGFLGVHEVLDLLDAHTSYHEARLDPNH